jgi:hypothetical protein
MIERSQQGKALGAKQKAEMGLKDYETGQPRDRSRLALRAERAKLESCKDGTIIAQGKRGTSAAPGYGRNLNRLPFFRVCRAVWRMLERAANLEKWGGWV